MAPGPFNVKRSAFNVEAPIGRRHKTLAEKRSSGQANIRKNVEEA